MERKGCSSIQDLQPVSTETEHGLQELLAETGQDKRSLIRQLIQQRWQQRKPAATISQRLGGHPAWFLNTLTAGSAERQQRRALLDKRLKARRADRC